MTKNIFRELKKFINKAKADNLVFFNGSRKWDTKISNHVIRFTCKEETYRYSNTTVTSWRILELEFQVFLEITIKMYNRKSEPFYITDTYEIFYG